MDTANVCPRDMVYCHQCENEWFRDEHGLECPTCHSDFTEIIEADHDPRSNVQDHFTNDDETHFTGGRGEYYAPDPDEDDIDNLHWQQTGPDTIRLHGTMRQDVTLGPDGRPQQHGVPQNQGLMGMFGNMLQTMIGGQQAQQQAQQGQQGIGEPPWQGQWFGSDAPPPPARPDSAPGSPLRSPPPHSPFGGGRNTIVRQGPGYSFSVTTINHNSLYPRNANGPQPLQNQPVDFQQMLGPMLANIGMRVGPGPRGMRSPDEDEHFMGTPFIIQAGGGGGQPINLANFFQLFAPPGGVAGDAVYSQEALDRIITQLMEQHQTGNAPGPASETAIKSLPTKQITAADQSDSGKAECSICMDEVPLGGTVTILPCHHWFHADCIRAWLSEHDTCPHCRQGIMPKDGDANSPRPRQPDQAPRHDMHSPEYTRPSMSGAFPFPRQDSAGSSRGDGTQQNPWIVPDSPTTNRRNSTGAQRRQSSGTGGGVFSRMRDAFGGGGGSGNAGSSSDHAFDQDDLYGIDELTATGQREQSRDLPSTSTDTDAVSTSPVATDLNRSRSALQDANNSTSQGAESTSIQSKTRPSLRKRMSTFFLGKKSGTKSVRKSSTKPALRHRTSTLSQSLNKSLGRHTTNIINLPTRLHNRHLRRKARKAREQADRDAQARVEEHRQALRTIDQHIVELRRAHSRFLALDADGAESLSMLESISGGGRRTRSLRERGSGETLASVVEGGTR